MPAVPTVAAGELTVDLTGTPDHCWTPLQVTFNATTTAGIAPYTYTFTWNYQYKQWGDDTFASYTTFPLLFTGAETSVVTSTALSIQKTHEFTIPGYYNVRVDVADSTGTALTGDDTFEIRTVGILPFPIAYDVKGSTQQIEVKGVNASAANTTISWWLESGVELSPADVTCTPAFPAANVWSVEIKSMKRGDIHIYAAVTDLECGSRTLHTEKKWGELDHTILDVDSVTSGVQHEEYVNVDADEMGDIEEVITDMAYATFYEVPGTPAVGHAITHWWLFEQSTANEAFIDDLMDYLADNDGALDDDYWAAHGKYVIDDLGGKQPFDYIDDYADTHHADTTIFDWDAISPVPPGEIAANGYYAWTETEDSFPAEVRGRAQATLTVDASELVVCEPEEVMIVVLVTYPGGSTAQNDPFNGENIVCLEKGTKTFHKGPPLPPAEQIKAPQVRWAGEKIVLEKKWGVEYAGDLVGFFLEEGSIGNLIPLPVETDSSFLVSGDARTAFTTVGSDGIARGMFETEQQGEVDIKCVLYDVSWAIGASYESVAQTAIDGGVVGNHGFLIYYLALEDVKVDEELSDLEVIEAGDDADVLVTVRGWFKSAALPGTARGPVLGEDGITYVRPAGRYILPDDWAALAGSNEATTNKASRPQYDLMNTPGDGVVSTAELGPYDSGVRTTTPPGEAEEPCIGPFNTLQPWSNFDALGNPTNMWIATASVVSSLLPDNLRNTVVPDTTIDWYDCPMPQALVTFDVDDTEVLNELDKGDVFVDGTDYTAPFYAVEIPSHWLIPTAGYFWDSWGADDPYNYWDDLGVTPNDDDILEVYSDNHGYAGVTIEGEDLDSTCVTVDVIADFPVMAAKYTSVATDQQVCWGIELEHLNADFEVSARTGEASITISFYGLKAAGTGLPWTTGGSEPYVKAEWDFDGNGTIDEVIETTTSADTLVTQTFEFTAGGSYSPWLRVTDNNGLVDVCAKPNYIVLTGGGGTVYWPCDIDESDTVNIFDFVLFAGAYGSSPVDANWDARCDLNGTNGVDIMDFVIFAQCYIAHAE